MPSFRSESNSIPVFTAGANATFTILTKEMMQNTQFEQWGKEQHPNQMKELDIGDVVLFHSNPSAGGCHYIGKICAIDPYTNRIALDIIDREGTVNRMSIDATVVWGQERKRDAASIQEVVDEAIRTKNRVWYDDLIADQITQTPDGKYSIPTMYGDPIIADSYKFTAGGHIIAFTDRAVISNIDATQEFDRTMERFKQALAIKCIQEQKQYICGSPSYVGKTMDEIQENLSKETYRTSFYLGREISEATELMQIPDRWGSKSVLVGPDYLMATDIDKYYRELAFAKNASALGYAPVRTIMSEWAASHSTKPLFGKGPQTEMECFQSRVKDFEKKLGKLAKDPDSLKMMLARSCYYHGLTPVFVQDFNEDKISLVEGHRPGLCIDDAKLTDMTSGGELHVRAGDADALYMNDLECIGVANGVFVAIGYNAAYSEETQHMWRMYSNIDFSEELQQVREAHMSEVLRSWGFDPTMLSKEGPKIEIEEIGDGHDEYTGPIIE